MVLPAPRPPLRPMTEPCRTSRPHWNPSASVCAGLCEMNVTMCLQSANSRFVAQFQATFLGDPPDATEAHFGKLLFPSIQQGHGVGAGRAEEQFKIFAVAQGAQERRLAGRFGAGLQFG